MVHDPTYHKRSMRDLGYVEVSLFDENHKQYKAEYVMRHKRIGSDLYLLIDEIK